MKDLRASPIGLRGLASAASALAKDVQAAYPGVVSTKVDAAGALDPQLQLVAYQVCKEALMNAAHHSRAAVIEVRLSSEGRYLRLEVSDNGVGFDPGYSSADHFGLLIMQERTEEAGGTLYVDSSPGAGTTVTAIFPLREGET